MNVIDKIEKDHFVEFIQINNETNLHHTGDLDGYCGLKYVKYDIMIDMEDVLHRKAGFDQLFALRPELEAPLTTGWENCTATGSPSIIDDIADTGHMYNISTNLMGMSVKHKTLDAVYCDANTTNAVYHRYIADYDILNRHVDVGGLKYQQHECYPEVQA